MLDPNRNQPIVLVVDDSPDSLGMINVALNEAGMTVLVALSGEQALSIIEQIEPDVILLDAVMPLLDGFATCTRLKAHSPLIPVLFMTGLTEIEHIVRGFEVGGVDYIVKPINPLELLARIKVHTTHAKLLHNAREALDSARQYIFAVDDYGQPLWTTPQAQQLIQASQLSPQQLSHQLRRWLAEQGTHQDLSLADAALTLTVKYFKLTHNHEHLLRIFDTQAILNAETLMQGLPTTKREAQVLLWVAQGKTNREIAAILSLSPRTINKHLEQLYPKLGVDNRTSAATLAIRILLGLPNA